jgi:hypothetical protein
MELVDPKSGIPGKRTRKRISQQKIAQLEKEFARRQYWDRKHQAYLGKKLKLDISKVYKWNWEKRKRLHC